MASYFATLWNKGLTQLEKGQLPRTIQVKFRRIMNYLYGVITNLHRHADFWQVDTFVVIGSWSIPSTPIISQNRILLTSALLTLLKHGLNQIAPCKGTQTGFRNLSQWNLDSGFQSLMEFWIPWAELFSGFQSPGFQFPALKFSGYGRFYKQKAPGFQNPDSLNGWTTEVNQSSAHIRISV